LNFSSGSDSDSSDTDSEPWRARARVDGGSTKGGVAGREVGSVGMGSSKGEEQEKEGDMGDEDSTTEDDGFSGGGGASSGEVAVGGPTVVKTPERK